MPQNSFIKVQKFSDFLIKAVIVIPCLVLAGWQFDIAALKSILPNLPAMNPLSAVLFILGGIAIYLIQEHNPDRNIRIGRFIGLFIAIIACVRIAAFNTNLDIGIDEILYGDKLNGVRMNPYSIFNFLLVGTSIFLVNDAKKGSLIPSQLFASFAFIISSLLLIDNLYAIGFSNSRPISKPIAIYTTVTFILLACSIFLSRYQKGFIRSVTQQNTGGRIIRKLMPIGIGVPLVTGLLILEGQRIGLYDEVFGSALSIMLIITVFALSMLWLAESLNKTDEKRKEAELSLISVKDELAENE